MELASIYPHFLSPLLMLKVVGFYRQGYVNACVTHSAVAMYGCTRVGVLRRWVQVQLPFLLTVCYSKSKPAVFFFSL